MATEQRIVIDKIKEACTALYTTILDKKVSEKLLTDVELPALCISELKTVFDKPCAREVQENYEVKLIIVIADNADPIEALSTIQANTIKALLAVTDVTFELKESTMSNAVLQYSFGSGISCVLSVTCSKVVSYNP